MLDLLLAIDHQAGPGVLHPDVSEEFREELGVRGVATDDDDPESTGVVGGLERVLTPDLIGRGGE